MEATEIVCVNVRCQKPVTLTKPQTEVVRANYCTVMIFHHGLEAQRCAHCGQAYVPYLQDLAGINFVWRAQQPDVDPLILRRKSAIPPTEG